MTSTTVVKAVADKENAPAVLTPEQTLSGLIKQQERAIARALPKGMDEARFARILLTTVKQTPDLLKCDPYSFLGAAMTAAQLGLEPGPLGEAYLVPYGRTCQFIPGAPGLVKLAIQSGHVRSVIARSVHQGDEFDYEYGLEERLVHRPVQDGEPGPATHHYAVAHFMNGGHEFVVMTAAAVEQHRRKFSKYDKVWKEHPEAMARKTVVKQLVKLLPKSAQMAQAATADGQSFRLTDTGDLGVIHPDEPAIQVTYGDAIDTDEASDQSTTTEGEQS